MKAIKWLAPLIAVLIIVTMVIYCHTQRLSVSDSGIMLQVSASLALAALTWGYMMSSASAVRNSSRQVEASRAMIDQAREARIKAIRPLVTMRYKLEDDNSQNNHDITTWLVNTGSGTACNIALYWNLREHRRPSGEVLIEGNIYDDKLIPSYLNRTAFGYPLIADNGSPELRICFFRSSANGFSSPLHVRGMKAIITYNDIEGNNYFTKIYENAHIFEEGSVDFLSEGIEMAME